jgi:hypothetical protein
MHKYKSLVAVTPCKYAHGEELTYQVAWAHKARREGNNVAEKLSICGANG